MSDERARPSYATITGGKVALQAADKLNAMTPETNPVLSRVNQFATEHPLGLSIKDVSGKKRVVADTDQHLFNSSGKKEVAKASKQYIKNNLRNTDHPYDSGNQSARLTSRSASKVSSYGSIPNDTYLHKQRLVPEIPNMLKASQLKDGSRAQPSLTSHPIGDTWDYPTVPVQVEGKNYTANLNIGKKAGDNILYDFNLHPNEKGSYLRPARSDRATQVYKDGNLTNTLPKTVEKVNAEPAKIPSENTRSLQQNLNQNGAKLHISKTADGEFRLSGKDSTGKSVSFKGDDGAVHILDFNLPT